MCVCVCVRMFVYVCVCLRVIASTSLPLYLSLSLPPTPPHFLCLSSSSPFTVVRLLFGAKVLKGKAELYGTELVEGKEYTFTDNSLPVFTWHGCDVEYRGQASNAYVAE